MKKPYEIHSDFFKKMIASGWYENREIILDSLPHHLIPQVVWKENKIFFNSFGMKGKGLGRDSWTNG